MDSNIISGLPKPKSRNIRKAIDRLAKMDLAKVSQSDIDSTIRALTACYVSYLATLKEGQFLYRARVCTKPNSLSELSYPPNKAVTVLGRGNAIGESVFYCSPSDLVALREIHCTVGDRVVISKWKSNSNMVLNHVGFTEETKLELRSERKLENVYGFVTKTNNYSDLNEMVYEYLGFQFSKAIAAHEEQAHYRLTSSIAHQLTGTDEVHGLMYPTNQLFGKTDNLLLKASAVDNNLEFLQCDYMEVVQKKGDTVTGKLLDYSTEVDVAGTIKWNNRPWPFKKGDKGFEVPIIFKKEAGVWEAHDATGEDFV